MELIKAFTGTKDEGKAGGNSINGYLFVFPKVTKVSKSYKPLIGI